MSHASQPLFAAIYLSSIAATVFVAKKKGRSPVRPWILSAAIFPPVSLICVVVFPVSKNDPVSWRQVVALVLVTVLALALFRTVAYGWPPWEDSKGKNVLCLLIPDGCASPPSN